MLRWLIGCFGAKAACRDRPGWTFISAGVHFLREVMDIAEKR